MARSDALVEHCLELFAPLGRVSARRMFGGVGFRVDDELFFALVAFDRLYLKADATTRADFAAAGGEPFVYEGGRGKRVALGYWTVPADAMESPALMAPWARLALQAAVAARAAKPKPAAARKAARTARDAAAPAKAPAAKATPTRRRTTAR